MHRLLTGIAIIAAALPLGFARAQVPVPVPLPVPVPFVKPYEPPERGENALQQAEGERVHRTTLKNIPNRKVSKDPWRNIRPAATAPDRHRPY